METTITRTARSRHESHDYTRHCGSRSTFLLHLWWVACLAWDGRPPGAPYLTSFTHGIHSGENETRPRAHWSGLSNTDTSHGGCAWLSILHSRHAHPRRGTMIVLRHTTHTRRNINHLLLNKSFDCLPIFEVLQIRSSFFELLKDMFLIDGARVFRCDPHG